ncbi:MAG: hypothetical protein QNJ90_12290 [Planctomycetota bacterium]|nr:hypothetical protein [Planctomycetota bacterium]
MSDAELAPEDFDTRLLTRKARRRRLIVGLAVLVIGVAVGATLGWSADEPLYRSKGLVFIAPSVPTPADPLGKNRPPMFDGFVDYQTSILESPRCANLAGETGAWKQQGRGEADEAGEAILRGRRVERLEGSASIEVAFTDRDPQVAVAGVQALIEAYTKLAGELNDADERLSFAQAQIELLQGKIKVTTDKILAFTSQYGGTEGLEIRHRSGLQQLLETEDALESLRLTIRTFQADVGPDGTGPVSAIEIALENAEVARLLLEIADLVAEDKYLAEKLGPQSEQRVVLQRRLGVRKEHLKRLVEAWHHRRARKAAGGATLPQLRDREKRLVQRLERLRMQNRRTGQTRADVERIQAERTGLGDKLKQMTGLKEQLEAQMAGSGRIRIADPGQLPTKYWRDRRPAYARLGGAIGAVPGLVLLLLAGFRGRRRSGSFEAA